MAKKYVNKLDPDEKNLHIGHRQRLLDLVHKNGIENVSNIQAVEFILTFIIPRVDVNPIAHRILDKFGTISNAMDADVNDIATIKGMSERAAKMLKSFVSISYLYTAGKYKDGDKIMSFNDLYEFMDKMLESRSNEAICLISLNSRRQIINYEILDSESIKNVGISPKRFSLFIHSCNPWAVAIGHNHPNGDCTPSELDIAGTQQLQAIAKNLEVEFLDSVVVSLNGVYSILKNHRVIEKKISEFDTLLRTFIPL